MGSSRPAPTRIAPDTFVVHDVVVDERIGLVPCNVLVIRGAEPVVVDTGLAEHGDALLEDIFGLVEPADLRWVMVSHADADHAGNVDALLEAAPRGDRAGRGGDARSGGHRRATVGSSTVTVSWSATVTCSSSPRRCSTPSRRSACTTRRPGCGGRSTRWPRPCRRHSWMSATSPRDDWHDGVVAMAQLLAPWLGLVDDRRFEAAIDRVAALGPAVIAGAHTPPIGHRCVPAALSILRDLGR